MGLEAARYRETPDFEFSAPAIAHHRLVLFIRPPRELDLRYEGVERHSPPPAGSITVVPAGRPARVRWSGSKHELHIFLEPGLVARVAAEAFGLDPARLTVPPMDGLNLPHLRAAMGAVSAELTAGGTEGRLAAESLANLLAVHLIRNADSARFPARRTYDALPRARLRAVVEYIDGHLDAGMSLEQMAALARLSPYHFARRFKATTGLPPHQFVIERRVDRARQFLQRDGGLSLAEIAVRAGFSDQSHLSNHFKRVVGVTPGQFRKCSRNPQEDVAQEDDGPLPTSGRDRAAFYRNGRKPDRSDGIMMQDAEADDAGRQRRPGVHDHAQPVVPHPHPPQPLEPTDRPLDHPADLPQPAAVRRLPLGDVRLDPQPPQQRPGRLAVVAPVGVHLVGQLLRPARLAADLGEVEHHAG